MALVPAFRKERLFANDGSSCNAPWMERPRPCLDGKMPEWNDTLCAEGEHVKEKGETN
jgi:hypothetical protein